MKNLLLLSSLAVVGAISVVGCADQTTTTTTQRSYSMDRSDPKDMSTTMAPPPPAPATNAIDTDTDESGGIHSSGNMGGMR